MVASLCDGEHLEITCLEYSSVLPIFKWGVTHLVRSADDTKPVHGFKLALPMVLELPNKHMPESFHKLFNIGPSIVDVVDPRRLPGQTCAASHDHLRARQKTSSDRRAKSTRNAPFLAGLARDEMFARYRIYLPNAFRTHSNADGCPIVLGRSSK
jgi:hypothetical protein